MLIDTDLDFETECSPGKDPDQHSPTLRAYQQRLWSKRLPDGTDLRWEPAPGLGLLRAQHADVDLVVSSDSIVSTYHGTRVVQPILDQLPQVDQDHFYREASKIAAKIIFPAHRVDNKITINGARGFSRKIADRMDLTLECIRRHYRGEASPMTEVLARYQFFFQLFSDFEGYVNFFLLQDLLTEDRSAVRFFLPFDGFATSGLPRDVGAYREYSTRSLRFLSARSSRIRRDTAAPGGVGHSNTVDQGA